MTPHRDPGMLQAPLEFLGWLPSRCHLFMCRPPDGIRRTAPGETVLTDTGFNGTSSLPIIVYHDYDGSDNGVPLLESIAWDLIPADSLWQRN
jgi:hypothetical protein